MPVFSELRDINGIVHDKELGVVRYDKMIREIKPIWVIHFDTLRFLNPIWFYGLHAPIERIPSTVVSLPNTTIFLSRKAKQI